MHFSISWTQWWNICTFLTTMPRLNLWILLIQHTVYSTSCLTVNWDFTSTQLCIVDIHGHAAVPQHMMVVVLTLVILFYKSVVRWDVLLSELFSPFKNKENVFFTQKNNIVRIKYLKSLDIENRHQNKHSLLSFPIIQGLLFCVQGKQPLFLLRKFPLLSSLKSLYTPRNIQWGCQYKHIFFFKETNICRNGWADYPMNQGLRICC